MRSGFGSHRWQSPARERRMLNGASRGPHPRWGLGASLRNTSGVHIQVICSENLAQILFVYEPYIAYNEHQMSR
jgi:hypothetical protein